MDWSPVKLQGTPYGRQAQQAEQGAEFTRTRRGGQGVFLPDESDGVTAAGKRTPSSYTIPIPIPIPVK